MVNANLPNIDHVSLGCITLSNSTKRCLDADIAEFLLYDTILEPYDIDRVAGYLSRKYSLPWEFSTAPQITAIQPSRGPTVGGTEVSVTEFSCRAAFVCHPPSNADKHYEVSESLTLTDETHPQVTLFGSGFDAVTENVRIQLGAVNATQITYPLFDDQVKLEDSSSVG